MTIKPTWLTIKRNSSELPPQGVGSGLSWLLAIALIALPMLALPGCGNDTPATGTPGTATGGTDADAQTSVDDTADATADVGQDVPLDTSADTGSTDQDTSPDTVDVAETTGIVCPGGAGCDCASDAECNGNKCLDTPGGKKCAQTCSGDTGCGTGFTCKVVGTGSDAASYCVSNFLSTCSPCQFNKDCQVNGIDALCVDYGAAGKFCGGTCSQDGDCPSSSFACTPVKDETSGTTSKQCKLKTVTNKGSDADCSTDPTVCAKGETCVSGKCAIVVQPVCECSSWAKNAGLQTQCSSTNQYGTCTATRKCTPDGLAACGAQTPAAESCNAKDDNCDGTVDNLAADYKCSKAAFKSSGSGDACKTDVDCAKAGEGCDTGQGKCLELIGKCFGKPTCAANGELICADANTPKLEVCNGEDDDCDGKIDEDFPYAAPDGSTKSYGDACGVGECGVGTVVCKDNLTAVCSTDSKAVKEACDAKDNDCNGKTDDATCDDSNVCTDDTCDGANAKCINTNNTAACDDKNLCTENDICGAGLCAGSAIDCGNQCEACDGASGKCINAKDGTTCSDANACTVGDSCGKNPLTSNFECLPGVVKQVCDDNNVCTDDACDTQKGCVNAANAATVPCYDGKDGTKSIGTCTGGQQLCKAGKLDKTCVGEITPAAVEACDGKDDNCNGQTDEGCKPTSVAVTFSSAYVSGKTGNLTLQMLVGPSGPVGKATGDANSKYSVDFGFLSWLMSLFK